MHSLFGPKIGCLYLKWLQLLNDLVNFKKLKFLWKLIKLLTFPTSYFSKIQNRFFIKNHPNVIYFLQTHPVSLYMTPWALTFLVECSFLVFSTNKQQVIGLMFFCNLQVSKKKKNKNVKINIVSLVLCNQSVDLSMQSLDNKLMKPCKIPEFWEIQISIDVPILLHSIWELLSTTLLMHALLITCISSSFFLFLPVSSGRN